LQALAKPHEDTVGGQNRRPCRFSHAASNISLFANGHSLRSLKVDFALGQLAYVGFDWDVTTE
jgi:hypothetical protein